MTSQSMMSKSAVSKSMKAAMSVQIIPTEAPEMLDLKTGAGLAFSVTKPTELEATEYTLVTIVMDISPSVSGFKALLEEAMRSAIKGCQMSGRVDNILIRIVLFHSLLKEVHGFIPAATIDPDNYEPFKCAGLTALHDAIGESVDATLIYAKQLRDSDYAVNGCVYIVTDGLDNDSAKYDIADLVALIKDAEQGEKLSSLLTVLVGVNSNAFDNGKRIGDVLKELQANVGITQYVDLGDASPKNLGKLGGHISKSVSSQSQRVKSGAPSQPVPF